MFKKSLFLLSVLSFSHLVYANDFYIGLGAGTASLKDKFTNTDPVIGITTYNEGDIGLLGSVYAGYEFNLPQNFNLGVETFATATSAQIEDNWNGNTYFVKERYTYGIRLLPGYQISPKTEVHLLAGYVMGNFHMRDNGVYQAQTIDKTLHANGTQIGIGASTKITQHIAVRGDLIYSHYQTKTNQGSTDTYENKLSNLDALVSVNSQFG